MALLASQFIIINKNSLKEMNRMMILWGHGRSTVTGPNKCCSLKHFQCIRDKMKTFQYLILSTSNILFKRPHTLLAVIVIIIFHASEPSHIFNKYFFLKIHIDLELFTQVHQALQRKAIVLCFKQCFQTSAIYHQEYLHIL